MYEIWLNLTWQDLLGGSPFLKPALDGRNFKILLSMSIYTYEFPLLKWLKSHFAMMVMMMWVSEKEVIVEFRAEFYAIFAVNIETYIFSTVMMEQKIFI